MEERKKRSNGGKVEGKRGGEKRKMRKGRRRCGGRGSNMQSVHVEGDEMRGKASTA